MRVSAAANDGPMIDSAFHELVLPPGIEEAGFAYGRACAHLLERPRLEAYLDALGRITRTRREDLGPLAQRWAGTLPARYQAQMAAMAVGARASLGDIQQWLYADIAAPSGGRASAPGSVCAPTDLVGGAGPMCSGVVTFEHGAPWVARNCDWYEPTLWRGTVAVTHRAPHRIPCVCVGLMGDIDADTGLNAEGLWLHMHTLLSSDEPRAGVSCISWLFWMREALEQCANLEQLEAFIVRTDRDRGVMLFAAHGPSGSAAIYECGRSSFTRVDPWEIGRSRALVGTNHCRHKHPEGPRAGAGNGTVSRYSRLLEILEHAPPETLPDDLTEMLGDERVEMRVASSGASLRTIYSAVAEPRGGRVWFASGACPAASRGTWRRVGGGW